jgi:hypothetical protein
MAFTVTKSWAASPYDKGLGINTPLGTGFLRKVSVVFDSGTTTGDVTAAHLGCSAILDVVSITMKTTNSVYAGTVTNSVIPLTASGNCTCEVLAIVRGL